MLITICSTICGHSLTSDHCILCRARQPNDAYVGYVRRVCSNSYFMYCSPTLPPSLPFFAFIFCIAWHFIPRLLCFCLLPAIQTAISYIYIYMPHLLLPLHTAAPHSFVIIFFYVRSFICEVDRENSTRVIKAPSRILKWLQLLQFAQLHYHVNQFPSLRFYA